MYHFWRQNPLFRPALSFALGIFLYDISGWSLLWLLPAGLFLAGQLIWQRFAVWKRVSVFIPLTLLLSGALFHSRQPVLLEMDAVEKCYLFEVCSELVHKEKSSHCEARILFFDSFGVALPSKPIRIKVNFRGDSLAGELLPGDRILSIGSLNQIDPPSNPNTFNYAAFMARKGIYYQLSLFPGTWAHYDQRSTLHRMAIQWRNKALAIYDKRIRDTENKAIIKALICGYVQELVPDIRDVYVKSGTMHMLSVSGMHVGILLIILGRSLFWLKKPLAKNMMLILLLWTYALLTGLSPSVMRAVSMCTLYLIGESIHKKHSSWNSVAFALLILLAWDTQFLFSAGFQLSFLALTGILLVSGINRPTSENVKDKLKNWLRSYLAVSFAAQLATSPIAIYYFHQFPVYFLIGNLLIVPLAAPMMYVGLLLLCVDQIPLISDLCASLLDLLLGLCQFVALKVAELPGASLGEIHWNLLFVLALYALIIGFVLKVKIQQSKGIFIGLILLCAAAFSSLDQTKSLKNQSGIIVYSFYGKTACDIYAGNKVVYLGDHLDEREFRSTVMPFRELKNLNQLLPTNNEAHKWGMSVLTDSLRILRIWDGHNLNLAPSKFPTLLLLEKNAECPRAALIDSINFCNIVLAGNLSWKSRKSCLEQLKNTKIPLHDIREQGAFQKELWKYSYGMK